MKITITRSFERTRQIADFVPIKAYCEATLEAEVSAALSAQEWETMSAALDNFVQSEVEKTLINYRPVCIACQGKGEKVLLNKEGVCGQCVEKHRMEAIGFAKENSKKK